MSYSLFLQPTHTRPLPHTTLTPIQPSPPSYNVTELNVPTALFTGGNDWLADPTDVNASIPLLNTTGEGRLSCEKIVDFMFSFYNSFKSNRFAVCHIHALQQYVKLFYSSHHCVIKGGLLVYRDPLIWLYYGLRG